MGTIHRFRSEIALLHGVPTQLRTVQKFSPDSNTQSVIWRTIPQIVPTEPHSDTFSPWNIIITIIITDSSGQLHCPQSTLSPL